MMMTKIVTLKTMTRQRKAAIEISLLKSTSRLINTEETENTKVWVIYRLVAKCSFKSTLWYYVKFEPNILPYSSFSVQIVADKNDYFDAFMLQARGKDGDDGNATYVGQWVKTPKIARTLNCLDYRRSAIIDVGKEIVFLLCIFQT